MNDKDWLMLNFTLPKEPSRVRVSVWRKLKKCGSVSIGSMWVLPVSDYYISIFKEISNEITQNNGSAYIVKAAFITQVGSPDVVNLFNSVRDGEYQEFIEKCEDFFREIDKETKKENFTFVELEENEDEYNKLVEWLKKIASRDFFQSPQKIEAEKNIELCKQWLDDFSNKVYEANEE